MKLNLNYLWKVLSMLVPIPEGYAVGVAILETLHWHISVVVVSSVIVAFTGFLAIDVTNRMSEFNNTLAGNEKQFTAPTWRGLIVMLIWFGGVMLLTVFLKVSPILATWTPLGLVVVGSSAAWLRSINIGQEARERQLSEFRGKQAEDLRKEKEARELERQETRKQRREARKARAMEENRIASMKQAISAQLQAKASSKKGAAEVSGDPAKRAGTRKSAVTDEQLILEYQNSPYVTSGELAKKFGVSRQAIDQKRDALSRDGLLKVVRHENGRVERVDVVMIAVGQGSS